MRGSLSTLYDSHWEPTIIKMKSGYPVTIQFLWRLIQTFLPHYVDQWHSWRQPVGKRLRVFPMQLRQEQLNKAVTPVDIFPYLRVPKRRLKIIWYIKPIARTTTLALARIKAPYSMERVFIFNIIPRYINVLFHRYS